MAAPRQTVQNNNQRQFWTDFFLLYESLPALWDMRNVLYKDKRAKLEAYDTMVEKLRQIEPNADRESVLRKINIFRTNYRRECSRINVSYLLGRHYKTTLWYYDLLNFLQSQETRREKKSSYKGSDGGEKSVLRKRRLSVSNSKPRKSSKSHLVELPQTIQEESYDYDEEIQYDYDMENENVVIEDIPDDEVTQLQHYQNEFQNFSLQRITHPKLQNSECSSNEFFGEAEVFAELIHEEQETEVNIPENEVIQQNEISLSAPPPLEEEEQEQDDVQWCVGSDNAAVFQQEIPEMIKQQSPKKILRQTMTSQSPKCKTSKTSEAAEILAKSWAIQYDEMSYSQKIYARKAIGDILFEGCMGNLGRDNDSVSTPISLQQMPHQEAEEEYQSNYVYEDENDVKYHDYIVKMK